MSMTEEEKFELDRRRLVEIVKENAEKDIFRYYRNVGSIVIGVLAAVGITIGWPALRSQIDHQISEQIKIQVQQPVQDAKDAAELALKSASNSLILLEAQEESIGRVRPKIEEIRMSFGESFQKIDDLIEKIEEFRELQEFLRNQTQAEPVKREEIIVVQKRLSDIVTQVQALASALQASGLPVDASAQIESAQEALVTIGEQLPAVEVSGLDYQSRSVVYVQFSGGRRDDIVKVTDILRKKGWKVPGEERNSGSNGKHEVRYFHRADENGASKLAEDLQIALDSVGFSSIKSIGVKEFDAGSFKSPPAEGILEVWLQIPLQ